MLSRKSQKLVKNVVCFVAALSGSVLASQSQVNAETFQIGGFGLNTNNNFARIDGQPKMSTWQTNPNDNDQQFDQVRGNRGGMMLKHRSTGKCVNAYRGNGSEFNVWPCNANDGDQNWNIINLGGGKVQLQKVGTNLCIDMPERRNYGRVHMIVCDRNNGNQQWVSSSQTTQPPVVQPPVQNPTIGIPVTWTLPAYRSNNIFWLSGYAPASQGSPNNKLNGALGNCTWYVNGRLQQLGYSKYALDSMPGNAQNWDNTAGRGVTISSTPKVGAIAQWESNHVAVVEQVNANGTIVISESSYYTNESRKTGSYLYNTRTIAANNPTRYLIVPK